MQAQIDIGFDQLVKLVKTLPSKQWVKLKEEVEKMPKEDKEREAFKQLLLNGPTFSKEQLETIKETRKAIDKWRKN